MEKEAHFMPLQYKIDVLAALKEKGYNTNKIRTEGLLSQSTLQKFRNKQGVSWENLEMLCYRFGSNLAMTVIKKGMVVA